MTVEQIIDPGDFPGPYEHTWNAKQALYIEWCGIPHGVKLVTEGMPVTQTDCVKWLGVSANTLSKWKKLPGFDEAVFRVAKSHLGARVGSILGALGDKAETGDVPAIKTSLEVLGLYTPGADVTVAVRAFGADRMAEAAADARDYERKRLAEALEAQQGEGDGEQEA